MSLSGADGGIVQGPVLACPANAAEYPQRGGGGPCRLDSLGQTFHKGQPSLPKARSPSQYHSWAGAVPGLARETVGAQGGIFAPRWASATVAVPRPGRVPPCQVPHGAGEGPTPAELPPEPHQARSPSSLSGVGHPALWGDRRGVHILADILWPPEFSSLTIMRCVLGECKSI